ncbi:iron donor protein CyaY [Paraliomyxa miuraensis]|uniref:iron donor protein CyaY n=1 Tax=Paraliomyxa miuraensis TaxID=376150 RepID=UPI002253BA69|nr:iron donor protein CyaY [Paraliomyxa miuraensis]MCX4248078.1 iron donor protein CyaY [Paraliomyxa miuraensis]
MERGRFLKLSAEALEHIDDVLGGLEHEDLDVDLAGDVLTLAFSDGGKFIINAHSAAGQIWMAANKDAWHFDYDEAGDRWVAPKNGDELMATVARTVGERLGQAISL